MTPPKHLYHYTSQRSLLSILESNKLWMTNIFYLNDSSEYSHIFDFLRSELSRHRDILAPLGLLDHIDEIEHVVKGLSDDPVKNHHFIFSFSEIPDDLNQWRGYCRQPGGICIEFDYEKLQTILDRKRALQEICFLHKCKYNPEEKREVLRDPIDHFLKELHSGRRADVMEHFELYLFLSVQGFIPILKHESFKDEIEHRLVYECKGLQFQLMGSLGR